MTDIEVRGGATDEELAALLAALASGGPGPRDVREDGYARWRRVRRGALARAGRQVPGKKVTTR